MAVYKYQVPDVDLGKLQAELIAAVGTPPIAYLNGGALGTVDVYVVTLLELTESELGQVAAVVAAHDGRQRRRRRLYDVFAAIGALTAAQKTAVGNDLFNGNPPKMALDEGNDAADLLVLYALAQTGLSTADKALVKQAAAAIYARDNPKYLLRPAFDPTINIPGDEPIP